MQPIPPPLSSRAAAALAAALGAVALAACGPDGERDERPPARLELRGPGLRPGGELPRAATCDGDGAAPVLAWSGTPDSAASLALLAEELPPDGEPRVLWSVWGLEPQSSTLLGSGPLEGRSAGGRTGWSPPCPPRGRPAHRYRFTIWALEEPLSLRRGASPEAMRAAVRERAIASGALELRYAR